MRDNKTGKRMGNLKKKMCGPKKKMCKKCARKRYPSMDISNKNVVEGKRKRRKTAKGRSYKIPALSNTVPRKIGPGASVKRTA